MKSLYDEVYADARYGSNWVPQRTGGAVFLAIHPIRTAVRSKLWNVPPRS